MYEQVINNSFNISIFLSYTLNKLRTSKINLSCQCSGVLTLNLLKLLNGLVHFLFLELPIINFRGY